MTSSPSVGWREVYREMGAPIPYADDRRAATGAVEATTVAPQK
jgi:hypothetical protein